MLDTLRRLLVRTAMLVEDIVALVLLLGLRLRGRHHATIVPFIGHGTPRRIRVHARIVLGRKETEAPATGVPGAAPPTRKTRRAILRASLARFVTVEVPRARVRVTVAGVTTEAVSNRDGYLDVVLDTDELAPGWHDVGMRLDNGTTVTAKVVVIDPAATIGLISDIDDTILETGLTRGLAFIEATLLTEVADRSPLPGAAALYRALTEPAGGPTRPVLYVSTSPWNLHEMLLEFISLRGFPLGPLQLTDWGPSGHGLFRIGATEHKTGLVQRILDEHPQLRLILIGDSGQLDPEIYAALAKARPDRIAAIYIRRTAHDIAIRVNQVETLAEEVRASGVPMMAANDSMEMAAHAAELGLLDPTTLPAIQAALRERPAVLRG